MREERVKKIHDRLSRRQPDLVVVMDNVHKPHNLSAVVRSCDAFGVQQVHAVWCEDQPRVLRGRSSGSYQWVTMHPHKTVTEPLTQLKEQGFAIYAAHFSERAVPFYERDYTRPVAIVLGAEKHGVSQEALSQVDGEIIVPMEGMVGSLNVSAAAAVILAEACRQRKAAGLYEKSRLPEAEYRKLFFEWCYPDLAAKCRQKGLPYPEVNEQGDLLDPQGFSRRFNGNESV